MVNNLELAVITKVLSEQSFSTLAKCGINAGYFQTEVGRAAYEFINTVFNHQDSYGKVPSIELLQSYVPGFTPLVNVPDAVDVLCVQMRRALLVSELKQAAMRIDEMAIQDPEEAMILLNQASRKMANISQVSDDKDISEMGDALRERYTKAKLSQGLVGIPFPWGPLNSATRGIQEGQYFLFYGRPKNGKTWMLLYSAVHAYLMGKKVLIVSFEMSQEELAARIAALLAQIDFDALEKGRLNPQQEALYLSVLNTLAEEQKDRSENGHEPRLRILSNRGGGNSHRGVTWLRAKAEEFEPDLICVDALYLMPDDGNVKKGSDQWKTITAVSQAVKQMCLNTGYRVLATVQANRKAEETDGDDVTELSYADALGQDTDGVFRVKKMRHEEPGNPIPTLTFKIKAPALRGGEFNGMEIRGNLCEDLSLIREFQFGDDQEGEKGKTQTYGSPQKERQVADARDPKLPRRIGRAGR